MTQSPLRRVHSKPRAVHQPYFQTAVRNVFVAHRGYSNYAPENSLPAFELAGKIGFWGIETDICETSDGQFVCMHDDTLDRTTNGSGAISDYTLDDLSQFQIDYGNYLDTNENLKYLLLKNIFDMQYIRKCTDYRNQKYH